jgi:hypothetical protein
VPTLPRLPLALLVAAIAVALPVAMASAASRTGAEVATPLLPDLVTLPVHDDGLVLEHGSKGHELLRLSNEIGNRGRGPLELYPSAASNNCDGDGNPGNDRDVFQRTFLDSNGDGTFERAQDTSSQHALVGCEQYHPAHHHWHLLDFSRYKLNRLKTGETVARSTKIGFCIIDSNHYLKGLPGSPKESHYPAGSSDCTENSIDGLSVGWADVYYYSLPGQQLNVTGAPAGRYCLVSSADPDHLLRESNDANNTRRTLVKMNPARHTVKPLAGPCRP